MFLEHENRELKKNIETLALENCRTKKVFKDDFKIRWHFYHHVKDELKERFPLLSWNELKKTSDKLFFSIHNR